MTTCYSHYSWIDRLLDSPICCCVLFFPNSFHILREVSEQGTKSQSHCSAMATQMLARDGPKASNSQSVRRGVSKAPAWYCPGLGDVSVLVCYCKYKTWAKKAMIPPKCALLSRQEHLCRWRWWLSCRSPAPRNVQCCVNETQEAALSGFLRSGLLVSLTLFKERAHLQEWRTRKL